MDHHGVGAAHGRNPRATGTSVGNQTQSNRIMDNTTFGLTMLVVGMGGTMLTLYVLSVLIGWLTRICWKLEEGGADD
jgi:hypothetical protein